MEVVIGVHVLYYLNEDNPFNDFTKNAEDGHWPVIFGFKGVIFLKKRNYFCHFVKRRKCCLLDRKVDDVCDCWQDVLNHELEDVGVNIVSSTGFAVLKPQDDLPYSVWMDK